MGAAGAASFSRASMAWKFTRRGPGVENIQIRDTRFEESRRMLEGVMEQRTSWKSERSD
jgi:hypothetical protein